jgi:hypothetical protein
LTNTKRGAFAGDGLIESDLGDASGLGLGDSSGGMIAGREQSEFAQHRGISFER